MAGDLEDAIAAALADAVVKSARAACGLAKADASALRKSARAAAREVVGETLTPYLVKLASLQERIEWLEANQAAGYGGGQRG